MKGEKQQCIQNWRDAIYKTYRIGFSWQKKAVIKIENNYAHVEGCYDFGRDHLFLYGMSFFINDEKPFTW